MIAVDSVLFHLVLPHFPCKSMHNATSAYVCVNQLIREPLIVYRCIEKDAKAVVRTMINGDASFSLISFLRRAMANHTKAISNSRSAVLCLMSKPVMPDNEYFVPSCIT